jgi:hypothetical protein
LTCVNDPSSTLPEQISALDSYIDGLESYLQYQGQDEIPDLIVGTPNESALSQQLTYRVMRWVPPDV